MDLPRGYNKTLQREFPDCRIRWSGAREEWQLERRANFARVDIDPAKYPATAVDTFIRRRDGYYLAGTYDARRLPHVERLVAFLRLMDPRNLPYNLDDPNAHNLIADELEKREAAAAAQAYASTKSEFVESGADILADANIPRSFVPRTAPVRDRGNFHAVRPGGPLAHPKEAESNGHECLSVDKKCDDQVHLERVALEPKINKEFGYDTERSSHRQLARMVAPGSV